MHLTNLSDYAKGLQRLLGGDINSASLRNQIKLKFSFKGKFLYFTTNIIRKFREHCTFTVLECGEAQEETPGTHCTVQYTNHKNIEIKLLSTTFQGGMYFTVHSREHIQTNCH